eukprot:TRINITY_DN1972_c0_g1_i1.p1 TRINITY_DN1972_c0_g1~~TRINITY_DN1972_c0_g1_i1.p1  ORF type:complete len:374 (-),score=182.65 TRINITY_DN1972_c0_g1_i1:170-1291(-)
MANKLYWIISAPETGRDRIFDMVSRQVGPNGTVSQFSVPALRVGTLDSLMALSDDLVRHDTYIESVTRKIANQIYSLFDSEDSSQLFSVNGANPDHYISHFKWDEAKFPIKSSCRDIVDSLNQHVSKLDEELRHKTSEYSSVAHNLSSNERNSSGNLMTRDLADIIKSEDWIDTEYLTTLFAVVPKFNHADWVNSYESFGEGVVPRSSKVIYEESDILLCSVVLFKKNADTFKNSARERRFIVRDFHYNAQKIAAAKQDAAKLKTSKDQLKSKLSLWCKTNFAEAFIAWSHLKAVRVFVESVLRFGLPANFEAAIVLPARKDDKTLRAALNQLFAYLGTKHLDDNEEEGGVGDSMPFFPYVSLSLNTEMRLLQ